ncbi:hypothetical protein [Alsobacter sp. R-9]
MSGDRNLDRLLAEAARIGRGDATAGVAPRPDGEVLASIARGSAVRARDRDQLLQAYRDAHRSVARREDLVDAASEMSFPASDPPSYMGGTGTAGGPAPPEAEPEKPSTRVSDPADVKPAKEDITNPASATPATKPPGS